jgi:hypothetical protein
MRLYFVKNSKKIVKNFIVPLIIAIFFIKIGAEIN